MGGYSLAAFPLFSAAFPKVNIVTRSSRENMFYEPLKMESILQ
jgi:hypothetical protein